MTARRVSVVVLLVVGLGWIASSPARAQVGLHVPARATCTPAIERITSDLTEFQKDAWDQGLDFLTAGTVPTGGAGLHWGPDEWSNPTLANAARLQAYRETMSQWADGVQRYRVVLTQFESCTTGGLPPAPYPYPGPDGLVPQGGIGLTWENCVKTYSTRLEPMVQQYVRTVLKQPAQTAMERVRKASSTVRSYAAKLGTPTSGAFGDVSGCINDYQARAQQVADSVNPGNPPVSQPAPQPKAGSGGTAATSGGGIGTGPLVAAGLVAAGAGVAVAAKAAAAAEEESANCDSQEATVWTRLTAYQNATNALVACSTQSCWDSRWGAFASTWSSVASALGNWCTCMGANFSSYFSSSEKVAIQEWWSYAREMGLNPGTMPNCFR
jgi:hypothetical protein